MLIPNHDIDVILFKYVQDEPLTTEEVLLLNAWVKEDEEARRTLLYRLKNDPEFVRANLKRLGESGFAKWFAAESRAEKLWKRIDGMIDEEGLWVGRDGNAPVPVLPVVNRRRLVVQYSMVAAVVMLIAGGVAFWRMRQHSGSVVAVEQPVVQLATPIPPGGNRATLTLGDGRTVALDSGSTGSLDRQGNVELSRPGDGKLVYTASTSFGTTPIYNTLATPRAGQFELMLPDGSRVWLNNASSLRYPVVFTGDRRTVELHGEGYFEVAKDVAHPFVVRVYRGNASNDVTVLGTSFNIMAYEDEPAEQATLVDGGIQVGSVVLKPGQGAAVDHAGGVKTLGQVNVGEVTAWKNGYFHFDHASLESTMRQLARWYDIDVVYEGTIAPQEYGGKIERNIPLAEILKALENKEVHFRQEGRVLVVHP